MNQLHMTETKRVDEFQFDAEIAPEELQVRRTKNYDQFKTIKGNRKVQIGHVNNLTKMINKYNLLPQFVGVVTKDGYLVDGQHRLASAKENKMWFYFTIIPENVDDIIVAIVNSVQLKWTIDDYVNFFADRGEAQYVWLRNLHNEYKVSNSSLMAFFTNRNMRINHLRNGTLKLFTTPDEEQILLALLDGYMDLKHSLDRQVWVDQDFILALRTMFQQVNSEEIKTAIDRWGKVIPTQDHAKDYMRLFEEIINKGKHGQSHIRFF